MAKMAANKNYQQVSNSLVEQKSTCANNKDMVCTSNFLVIGKKMFLLDSRELK